MAGRLVLGWSPLQIAGRPARKDDTSTLGSPETIYRTICALPCGEVHKQPLAHLRRAHPQRMLRARGGRRVPGFLIGTSSTHESPEGTYSDARPPITGTAGIRAPTTKTPMVWHANTCPRTSTCPASRRPASTTSPPGLNIRPARSLTSLHLPKSSSTISSTHAPALLFRSGSMPRSTNDDQVNCWQ